MPQPPMPGGHASECFATAARKASRRLTQFYDDALEPCGLRSTQYAMLNELARSAHPPTLAELASALVSDRSSVGHNSEAARAGRLYRARAGGGGSPRTADRFDPSGPSKTGARLGSFGRRPRTNFSQSMGGSGAKASARRCSTSPMTRGSAEPIGAAP